MVLRSYKHVIALQRFCKVEKYEKIRNNSTVRYSVLKTAEHGSLEFDNFAFLFVNLI